MLREISRSQKTKSVLLLHLYEVLRVVKIIERKAGGGVLGDRVGHGALEAPHMSTQAT